MQGYNLSPKKVQLIYSDDLDSVRALLSPRGGGAYSILDTLGGGSLSPGPFVILGPNMTKGPGRGREGAC